jgi:hypothetical protein
VECLLRDIATVSPAASTDAPLLAELIARTGVAEPGQRWPVTAGRVTLGAVAVPGVPQVAPEIAGCRAEIALQDGVWLVTDLGSDAVRVDGEPLDGVSALAPGSTIRCGELEAVFLPHDRWEPTPTEAQAAVVESAAVSEATVPLDDAPRQPMPAQPVLFAAMPASAPRRVPVWLILSLVVLAAVAAAAVIILRSR